MDESIRTSFEEDVKSLRRSAADQRKAAEKYQKQADDALVSKDRAVKDAQHFDAMADVIETKVLA